MIIITGVNLFFFKKMVNFSFVNASVCESFYEEKV